MIDLGITEYTIENFPALLDSIDGSHCGSCSEYMTFYDKDGIVEETSDEGVWWLHDYFSHRSKFDALYPEQVNFEEYQNWRLVHTNGIDIVGIYFDKPRSIQNVGYRLEEV